MRAAAVLGCDGATARCAPRSAPACATCGFTERWLVVDVRAPSADGWGGVDQVCDPHRAATFMHLTGDRYRWEFRMRPGETGDDLAADPRRAHRAVDGRRPAR